MLIKKSQTILKRLWGLKFSVWFTLRAQKTKPCFVTLTTFFRSTAGQDFQNTKWPAVGKRKEERGMRKEERGSCSLRSKRFRTSSSRKLGREQKKKEWRGRGRAKKETLARKPPGGYSHTLPIRVCAAQRGRDFEAPGLERGIHFRRGF